ncbi:hydrogenase maturation protease HycI [Methanocaldococcus vulcanius M7]|uniref:Hydrogenase maturation protease HycI n=1 Tax=Methanocaldococcus vulcanius (strain ATCC 700851 / DSM 12094 / M7) TaxID=579137 RepID=C9RDM8_METVM|nr:hydrogenase maturation peptidase HycI [Methanocaldococcus vulcanius]ACX73407.1 hydrogenase maturation protease HycI [Methanocaldococcus vulcanius M7]
MNKIDDIEQELLEHLKNCKKLVIMGLGNELKGDDFVGIYIIKKLVNHYNTNKEKNKKNEEKDSEFEVFKLRNLCIINAGTVPDFFTDIIKEENPSHLLIVDCAIMEKNPGDVEIIEEYRIKNFNLSTHTLPINVIIKYIKKFIDVKVIILGIQPKIVDFCPMSSEVEETGKNLTEILIKIIDKLNLTGVYHDYKNKS